jgi:hypothetical protein
MSAVCVLRSATGRDPDTCGLIYDPCLPSSLLSAATLLDSIADKVPSPAPPSPAVVFASATPFARKLLMFYGQLRAKLDRQCSSVH